MSERLVALVQSTWDPYLLDYVVQNLKVGFHEEGDVERNVKDAYEAALKKRMYLSLVAIANLLVNIKQQQVVSHQRMRVESARDQLEPLPKIARESPGSLSGKLANQDPTVRLVAVRLIELYRPDLESDLIERLDDPEREVRRAAHRALVRLARGTDLGPKPSADRIERLQAMRLWREWLALQVAPTQTLVAQRKLEGDRAPGQPNSAPVRGAKPTTIVLSPTDARARRLAVELIEAPADQQEQVLAKLKDGEGEVYTRALAAAMPQLSDAMRTKARKALAERLSRNTAQALRDNLGDDDPEIRRAAAVACALKDSREHIPELIVLLGDSEPIVADAAHTALKRLTREDFGPKSDASQAERIQAIAAWHAWWKKKDTKVTQAR